MKPTLARIPLLPATPALGQVVTIVVGGTVLDMEWDGKAWRLRGAR